ncbi:MAG: hypothetical protein NT018_04215 [Armatimonadetes bacterium]|nr:hypothetical protein [Armatimonadota bacterium]
MDIKTKTKVYLLILSVIMSLMGMIIMKLHQSGPMVSAGKPITPIKSGQLKALEKFGSKSPEMSKFLQHETEVREANQEAVDQ